MTKLKIAIVGCLLATLAGCENDSLVQWNGSECPSTCNGDKVCCNGVCVNITSNKNHCGVCGNSCDGAGEFCQQGVCTTAACEPTTCAKENKNCGQISDGCGNTLNCGDCGESQVCADNVCIDQSACEPTTCAKENKNCGQISDGCGNTLNCGDCGESQVCADNVCIDQSACEPTTCAKENKNCGQISDGCGNTLNCGDCGESQVCADNVCIDQSACEPTTCVKENKNCGQISDGCGNTLNCGDCGESQVCADNVCIDQSACEPTTCAKENKNCGQISDGCGNTLNCGDCGESQVCADNVCTAKPCQPATCAQKGKNCGQISDGCGNTLNCGSCADNQTCTDNVCKAKPASIKDTYPVRKGIKGLQPDFQSIDQVTGNEVHGVAMNLVWATWQPTQTGSCGAGQVLYEGNCFTVDANTENAIRTYTVRGVVVTAVVYGVPSWARRSCSLNSIFCAPLDGKEVDYGRFTGFLAWYFNGEQGHGRIADFVIHNEVNAYTWFNIGCSNLNCPVDTWTTVYANNYNRAYDAIRKEQKQAKVLISFDHYWGQNVSPSMSAEKFLRSLVPKLGSRDWMLAFHSYPPDLLNPAFGADDYNNHGIISFGNIGVLAGWLRKNYPSDAHAWEIMLTENGINGRTSAMQTQQNSQLCQAFRNVLGTPGITNLIYHRLVDHPDEVDAGLACGLWNANGSQKPAWTTFALANRSGVGSGWPSCGFEYLPYVRMMRGNGKGYHWVTTRQFPSGVTTEQSWKILRDPAPDTKIVYECRVGGANGNHTLISPDVNCENQFNMGPMGYVYTKAVDGTSPIYRCIIPSTGDHFISSDPNCEGQKTESLIGYGFKI